jgi:molybdopterin synthase catalytic subunit
VVELTRTPIDVETLLRAVESPWLGGLVLFVGEVRSLTAGRETTKLIYDAYEEMAIPQMRAIADHARSQWGANVAMAHRLGELLPGDIAVVTAAACPHRNEAFDCCRFLIDSLKADVPIWKQEFGPDGAAWIEGENPV